jgi:hypothetical protein
MRARFFRATIWNVPSLADTIMEVEKMLDEEGLVPTQGSDRDLCPGGGEVTNHGCIKKDAQHAGDTETRELSPSTKKERE